MSNKTMDNHNPLLVPKALALSLSPPRFPPIGTAEWTFYNTAAATTASSASSTAAAASTAQNHYSVDPFRRQKDQSSDVSQEKRHPRSDHAMTPRHSSLEQYAWEQWRRNSTRQKGQGRQMHPHLSMTSPHALTRRIFGQWISVDYQNRLRDGGHFRSIVDGLVVASLPIVALSSPRHVASFLKLTQACEIVQYGSHPLQQMHLYHCHNAPSPNGSTAAQSLSPATSSSRWIFFVHGGAWGSGQPWMYRLVASSAAPFVQLGYSVAVVGYRTYPDASAVDQVDDLERAASLLHSKYCDKGDSGVMKQSQSSSTPSDIILMGHSSGAHIALLLLIRRLAMQSSLSAVPSPLSPPKQSLLLFSAYIGLSGPYNIAHHFEYEAARGVEELSPMKAANGRTGTQHEMERHSPALVLQRSLAAMNEQQALAETTAATNGNTQPKSPFASLASLSILLLHGIIDDTVPFTATAEAARVLRSCGLTQVDEVYAPDTGHQDVVMQLMLGGPSQDAIVDWMQCRNQRQDMASRPVLLATSKL